MSPKIENECADPFRDLHQRFRGTDGQVLEVLPLSSAVVGPACFFALPFERDGVVTWNDRGAGSRHKLGRGRSMSNVGRIMGISALIVAPTIAVVTYLALEPKSRSSGPPSAPEDVGVPIASRTTSEPQEPPKVSDDVAAAAPLPAPAIPRDVKAPLVPETESASIPVPTVEQEPSSPEKPGSGERKGMRRREGTKLHNVEGVVSKRGTDYQFRPNDASRPMILLGNQVLERIEQYEAAKSREGKRLIWSLSGQVTEYHGENYLLATGAHISTISDRDSLDLEGRQEPK